MTKIKVVRYAIDILWAMVIALIIIHSPFSFDEKLIFTILYVGVTLSTRMCNCTREIATEIFRLK